MAQINFRIDDDTKRAAEALFKSLGLTMSSAITLFLNQCINERGIPFIVRLPDSKYHEKLLQAKRDYEDGRKNFHNHNLIEVDDKAKKPAKTKTRGAVRRQKKSRRTD